MEEEGGQAPKHELLDLAAAFRGVLEWKWDGRFGTVLAEFPIDKKTDVLGRLEQHLVSSWDSATIQDAPEGARQVMRHLGGLMTGQLLLLSDPAGDLLIYCAWWPWGNGQTISIRVGLFSARLDGDESQDLTNVLKAAFGVS